MLLFFFFLWTNKTSAQHLLLIGCRVLHTHCGGHCIIENMVSKRQQQCVNLTNGRNKNTTTYCTKLLQHMPHTYYMSTTNGKMDQRRECVHDAKKHDGSSPILPNNFVGKCNGCSEKKKNAWCSFRHARLIFKRSVAWKCTWNVITMPLHSILCRKCSNAALWRKNSLVCCICVSKDKETR